MVTSAFAESLVDTKDNRLREAKRYLKATQPEEMMEDMAKNMAQNIPESERQEFIDLMTKHLDMKSFEKLMTDSMIKHFTAEELKALADFYSSPVGKSAMKKFGLFLQDKVRLWRLNNIVKIWFFNLCHSYTNLYIGIPIKL